MTYSSGRWKSLVYRFPLLGRRGFFWTLVLLFLGLGGGLGGWIAWYLTQPLPITRESDLHPKSPSVMPSTNTTGLGGWADAYEKASKMLKRMSLEDKVSLVSGASSNSSCHGAIAPLEHLNFTGLCLADSANGLRGTDFVSGYPCGIHVGASWNRNLTKLRGSSVGAEFRRKGVNVLLGPVVGPLGRVPKGGRNWESFSPDPYLAGALAYETIQGIQSQGVIASTKHFIGNEQESYRRKVGSVEAVSSNIDEKTLHEVYLWPFQDAVKAGTGSIMCSYQRFNNVDACSNSYLLNGLLKDELGFQGFVVSDWDAQTSGPGSALSGLDMAMPNGTTHWGSKLVNATLSNAHNSALNNTVPEWRVDDMKQDAKITEPGKGMPKDVSAKHEAVEARDPHADSVLFYGAVEGHVLVKNLNEALPLKKPKTISVFGYSAKSPYTLTHRGNSDIFQWQFGAQSVSGDEVQAGFAGEVGYPFSSIARNGTLFHGGGSGATTPASFISPFEALKVRTSLKHITLLHDFESSKPVVNPASDVCLVFGNAWSSEGYDRPSLRDEYTDTLIRSVADQCENTVVILHNAGIRLVESFVEHPNVTSIIYAHLPGQESGIAITSLLFGDTNFSGKLPYTVAKNESDYGDALKPNKPKGEYRWFPQSNFKEGTHIDYRWFESQPIKPRYEFGFGLSYTSLNFSSLFTAQGSMCNTQEFPAGVVLPGGQRDLWDTLARVVVRVGNEGSRAGSEVVQLYVQAPDSQVKQLRGFEKVFLKPGEVQEVQMTLTRRDLSVWNTEYHSWQLQPGKYGIFVGNSSSNLPLHRKMGIC